MREIFLGLPKATEIGTKGSDNLTDIRPIAPNDDEWRALYEAASKFFALKPWQWMDDIHLFGVYDQETQTVGYGCIMGALGEVLGLGMYPGARGYNELLALREVGDDEATLADTASHHFALMAGFDNRQDLSKEDLQIIRRLGLTFRGRQAWPNFRFYEPGYWPSPLVAPQARFLTQALYQAAIVSQNYQNDPDALLKRPDKVLVRRPGKTGREWVDVWEPLPDKVFTVEGGEEPDAGFIKLGRSLPQVEAIWEIDIFYLPVTIGKAEVRPKMPRVSLVVDHESGLVFDIIVEEDHFIERVWHSLIQTMRKVGGRPQSFWVRQPNVALSLMQFAEALDITVVRFPLLPQVTEARMNLLSSLLNG